jgi:hypothetical protein
MPSGDYQPVFADFNALPAAHLLIENFVTIINAIKSVFMHALQIHLTRPHIAFASANL